MPSKKRIDFSDIAWPFNLLKSNLSIKQMEAGQEIEIVVDDPDVLKSLTLIVDQSPGYEFSCTAENEAYTLAVKRNG